MYQRGVYDISVSIYIDDRLTDQQPTSLWKISNGDISATDHIIVVISLLVHCMFCSRVWFLGLADGMALFPDGTNTIGI